MAVRGFALLNRDQLRAQRPRDGSDLATGDVMFHAAINESPHSGKYRRGSR